MFSNCSGECCVCGCGSGCLAGNGDDDFYPASTEEIIDRLNRNEYSDYTNMMLSELRNRGVEYDTSNIGSLPRKALRSFILPDDDEIAQIIKEVFGN